MALEFICSQNILKGEKIPIPRNYSRNANCFRKSSGKIKFFKSNPAFCEKTEIIPEQAVEISFENYEEHKHHIVYGNPSFYDSQRNVIRNVLK